MSALAGRAGRSARCGHCWSLDRSLALCKHCRLPASYTPFTVSDLAAIFSAAPPLQSLAQVPPASLASSPPAVAVAVMPRPPLFSMPPKKKAQPKPKSKLQVCCRR